MRPLFLGSHPAIDFLNTAFAPNGVPIETISHARALLDWLVAAGLLEEAAAAKLARRVGGKALDAAAAEAKNRTMHPRTCRSGVLPAGLRNFNSLRFTYFSTFPLSAKVWSRRCAHGPRVVSGDARSGHALSGDAGIQLPAGGGMHEDHE